MLNHYKLEPPFVVAFSGGESSAFMLRNIIDAHGGSMPEQSKVLFTNTGLEHDATLEFVDRVAREWGVDVVWLEYNGPKSWEIVDIDTACRDGEPFAQLIEDKGYLPTPVARVCTTNLKMRTMYHYLRSLGWDEWDAAIGLRADEPRRAQRIKGDHAAETPVCPMYHAGHTLEDVEAFWASHPWRLGIPRWMGNCCGCFLKSRGRIEMVAEAEPERLDWWAGIEKRTGKRFRIDRPGYDQILTQVTIQGRLFDDDGSTMPCSCTD